MKSDGFAARLASGRFLPGANAPGETTVDLYRRECARPGKGTVVAQLGVPNETALRKSNGESHLRRAVSSERRGQDSWKSASSPLPSTPASCLASVRKPLNRNRLRHAFLSEPATGSRLGFLPPVCTRCAPLVHQPKTVQIAGGSKTILSRYRPCQILASGPARERHRECCACFPFLSPYASSSWTARA